MILIINYINTQIFIFQSVFFVYDSGLRGGIKRMRLNYTLYPVSLAASIRYRLCQCNTESKNMKAYYTIYKYNHGTERFRKC